MKIDQAASLRSHGRCRRSPPGAGPINQIGQSMKGNTVMNTHLKSEALEMSELDLVSGGIWKYSSRLGAAGEQLEQRQIDKYGVVFNPGTLDAAAHQALEGWVTIP
jgi:hypothetical protein